MAICVCIPENFWMRNSDLEIGRMVAEVRRFQGLLEKTANQALNTRRLIMSRQAVWDATLERAVLRKTHERVLGEIEPSRFPSTRVPDEKISKDLPFAILPSEIRTWTEHLDSLFNASDPWIRDLLADGKHGIVLIPEIHPEESFQTASSNQSDLSPSRIGLQEIRIGIGTDLSFEHETEQVGENEYTLFKEEITKAINDHSVLNVSHYHHQVLTAGLHEAIFRGQNHANLGIIYDDNSRGPDFPIQARLVTEDQITEMEAIEPLRCALMSMRHTEMDSAVDIAWFNNQETSLRGKYSAEIDRICYERSLRLLSNLPKGEPHCIWMYQTGFQPAILGFYRAIAETLFQGSIKIGVKPMIFQNNNQYRPCDWWV